MNRVKRKYVPDLTEYMSQCELNYALMMRLLRLSESSAQEQMNASLKAFLKLDSDTREKIALPFHIEIEDQARYTTTLNLTVELIKSEWISPIKLRVRLYHDAQLAEVLESDRNYAPKSGHRYPQQVKHYPDDKYQRNQLLNQCLRRCFETSADQVAVPVVTYAGN